MKKAEDIYKKYKNFISGVSKEEVTSLIRRIQVDAIRETVQACADSAKLKYALYGNIPPKDIDEYTELCIDKSSILEVAEKLIKELE